MILLLTCCRGFLILTRSVFVINHMKHEMIIDEFFLKLQVYFGLRPSPAILGALISNYLLKYKSDNSYMVKLIQESLYVDDLVCGEISIERAFGIAEMILEGQVAEEEESYAKIHFPGLVTQGYLLSVGIIKLMNFLFDFTYLIAYVRQMLPSMKSALKFTAKIYDPLGFFTGSFCDLFEGFISSIVYKSTEVG